MPSTYGQPMTTSADTFTLEYIKGSLYRLRNTSDTEITVDSVDNKDEFFRIDLQPGTNLAPGRSTDFIIGGANGKPVPGELVVKLADGDAQAVIPIPPKL